MQAIRNFKKWILVIEAHILQYYALKTEHSAAEFLIDENSLKQMGIAAQERKAQVLVVNENKEMFLALYFSSEVVQELARFSPLEGIPNKNLQSFCLLVEELSHFHLLLQRAMQNRQVSQLELEWQAEVDKFLFPSLFISRGHSAQAMQKLLPRLYQNVSFLDARPHYREANDLALKFWGFLLARGLGKSFSLATPNFCSFMRLNYNRALQEKFPFSDSSIFRIGA